MTITVRSVPDIMRRHGATKSNAEWEKPARLQETWFNGAAHIARPVGNNRFDFTHVVGPNESDVTLDWILQSNVDQDGRARRACDVLRAAVGANTADELAELKKRIDALFRATSNNAVELGSIRSPASLEAFHAQRTAFSSVQTDLLDTPIDPLLGALGRFNFYAIPIGRASKNADGIVKVEIKEYMTYALDSFDFNGSQWLGVFDEPDVVSKNPADGTVLGNDDYGAWRTANGKGRDFLVLTDVRTVPVALAFDYVSAPELNGTWRSTDPKGRFTLAIHADEVEWTETGPETGLTYRNHFPIVRNGDAWRIARSNHDPAVLDMLGFRDKQLQDAILTSEPRDSLLVIRMQGPALSATWSGIRVQKTPEGTFKALLQPGDAGNTALEYALRRT